MAVLSALKRHEGAIVRLARFRDKYIIDGKVLDSNMRLINWNPVELPAPCANSIICNDYMYIQSKLDSYLTSYDIAGTTYIRTFYNDRRPIDVSNGSINSEWMGFTWSNPSNPDENYIINRIQRKYAGGEPKISQLTKLDRNGNIVAKVDISIVLPRIYFVNDTHIAIIGMTSLSSSAFTYPNINEYRSYVFIFNKNTLSYVREVPMFSDDSHDLIRHYTFMPTVIYRDDHMIAMIASGGNVIHQDISNKVNYPVTSTTLRSGSKQDFAHDNLDAAKIPYHTYTAPMKNGFHYGLNCSNILDGPIKWGCVRFNPEDRTYDSYPARENTIVWDDKIPAPLRNFGYYRDISTSPEKIKYYDTVQAFISYKLSETKFITFMTAVRGLLKFISFDLTRMTRWYICEIDETDPKKIKVLNAGMMTQLYMEYIIPNGRNIFLLHVADKAIHEFRVDLENNNLVQTRDIPTPNLCSMGLIDGTIWWVNYDTNELHYEMESYYGLNSRIHVEDRFEKDDVVLADPDTPSSNNYKISIYDQNRNRVSIKVRLVAVGAIKFDDNETTKIIETSTSEDITVPITVYGAAENYIKVELVGELGNPSIQPTVPNQKSNADQFHEFFKNVGLKPYALCGLMGNIYVESKFIPNNLENRFEKSLGMNDDEYTKVVDDGSYTNFVRDKAGYGLAQWTYWSRKKNFLDYAKSKGTSIGDMEMQLAYLWKELQESIDIAKLNAFNSVREASDYILHQFERPTDQSEEVEIRRAGYGQEFYNKYYG